MRGQYTNIWARSGLVLLVCAMCGVYGAAVPDIQEVLQSMKDADRKYLTHSMTFEYRLHEETSAGDKGKYFTQVTTRREEATGRFERKVLHYTLAPGEPEKLVLNLNNHRLWTGDMAYDWGVAEESTLKPLMISKRPERVITDAKGSGGELLRGTVGDRKPAWDVMAEQDGRVLDAREDVDGVPCLVLKSSGPYGEMTMWIDDAHEYVIRKLVLLKGPNSLSYVGIELSKYPDATSEWEFWLEDIQVELIDGHYVSVGGTLKQRSVSKEGTQTSTENIKITSIDFDPDFAAEGAFQLDVPDGTEVWDEDVQGLRYRWNKGELVPMVDPEEVDALKRTTEQMVLAQDSPQSVQPQEMQLPQAAAGTSTRTESGFPVRTAGSVVLAAIGCVLLLLAIRNRKRVKAANSEAPPE